MEEEEEVVGGGVGRACVETAVATLVTVWHQNARTKPRPNVRYSPPTMLCTCCHGRMWGCAIQCWDAAACSLRHDVPCAHRLPSTNGVQSPLGLWQGPDVPGLQGGHLQSSVPSGHRPVSSSAQQMPLAESWQGPLVRYLQREQDAASTAGGLKTAKVSSPPSAANTAPSEVPLAGSGVPSPAPAPTPLALSCPCTAAASRSSRDS